MPLPQDVDECASRPCYNRGVCHHQTQYVVGYSENPQAPDPPLGEYGCSCQSGYSGESCEIVEPTLRFFSLRGPCVQTNCANPRTVQSATDVLAAAFGVTQSNLVDVVVTQIPDGSRGDQVNFTLSTHDAEVNGMTVANLLPSGWLVLEAEVQACDESRDAGSVLSALESCSVNPCAGYVASTADEPTKGAETCPTGRVVEGADNRRGGLFPRPDHTRAPAGECTCDGCPQADIDACAAVTALQTRTECDAVLTADPSDASDTKACTYRDRYWVGARDLGQDTRFRCILTEATDSSGTPCDDPGATCEAGVTPGGCVPNPILTAGEVTCTYNPGEWDASENIWTVDSCTSTSHTSGCQLTGSLAGGDEACTPVATQCDTGVASWQAGQAYVPGDVDTPSTTCPEGCIFQPAHEEGATNIVDCVALYGQLMADVDLDLYILEDLSTSFDDDIENLVSLSRKFTNTIDMMFRSSKVGIGSFVDVGGYCFRNDFELEDRTAGQLQNAMETLETSGQGFMDSLFGRGTRCQGSWSISSVTAADGEASLKGLFEVGRKHAELGFSAPASEGMRVVLMSTDDLFKLGDDGDDATAPGRDIGCPDTEAGGWCGRIPSVAEVREQLESSVPPILPVFAIAGANIHARSVTSPSSAPGSIFAPPDTPGPHVQVQRSVLAVGNRRAPGRKRAPHGLLSGCDGSPWTRLEQVRPAAPAGLVRLRRDRRGRAPAACGRPA